MQETDQRFLYRVRSGESSLHVEVGTYDPERWKQEDGTRTGGIRFGESAEVHLFADLFGSFDEPIAEVSMGAIGSHDAATAQRRVAVYMAAIFVAMIANQMTAAGWTVLAIGEWFEQHLPQTEPTTSVVQTGPEL